MENILSLMVILRSATPRKNTFVIKAGIEPMHRRSCSNSYDAYSASARYLVKPKNEKDRKSIFI